MVYNFNLNRQRVWQTLLIGRGLIRMRKAVPFHEQKSFSREIPGKEFEESVKSRKAHWRACSFCREPMLMVTLRLDEPDRWSSSGYKMDRDPQVLGFLRNCLLPTKV